MELLKERIRKEGKILPGNIVKVDGFLNHRIDVPLMEQIAQEFRRVFAGKDITLVLTAEASGIALATICAQAFGVPMVFAKKAKSDNIEGGLYQSDILSYTYKKKVTLLVSKEWLSASDKVLIIDDFMARGEAMRGLCDIVREAGPNSSASVSRWKRASSTAVTACARPVSRCIRSPSSRARTKTALSSGRNEHGNDSRSGLWRAV